MHEITVQQKVERALLESEALFESLYESVPAGAIMQTPDGKIVHANHWACEILGFESYDLETKSSHDKVWRMIDDEGNEIAGSDHPSMITARTGEPLRNELSAFADYVAGGQRGELASIEEGLRTIRVLRDAHYPSNP